MLGRWRRGAVCEGVMALVGESRVANPQGVIKPEHAGAVGNLVQSFYSKQTGNARSVGLEDFLDPRTGVDQGERFRVRLDQMVYKVNLLDRVTENLEVGLVGLAGRVGLWASYVIGVGEHGGKLRVRIVTIPRKRSRIDLLAGPTPGEKNLPAQKGDHA